MFLSLSTSFFYFTGKVDRKNVCYRKIYLLSIITSEYFFNSTFSYFKKEKEMASSKQCDTCKKPSVSMHCMGCDKYFCNKDFPTHREVLFGEMDKIVESRNELQEDIQKSMQSEDQQSSIINNIDKWEKTTIKKVQDVAALARHQAIQLLNTNRIKVHTEFKNFSQQLATLRESGDFLEHDLDRLNQMINQFKLDIKQSTQPVNIKLHTEQSDRTIWESLIYVEEVQQETRIGMLSKNIF